MAGLSSLAPGLYIAATPLGNLGDITLRVLETLRQADLILCEDTRVTAKLLNHFGIKTPMLAFHDHNTAREIPSILERLEAGERIVQVTDAGTPVISDPGFSLVRAARGKGLPVTALPGPSAVITALSIAGLPADKFLFLGFLPPKQGARRQLLGAYAAVPATLVTYESPRRLADCLADMSEVLGQREAVICRELTKFHEEVRRGILGDLATTYRQEETPRGEIVILVAPPAAESTDSKTTQSLLEDALKTLSVREAADAVARATARPKREIYQLALEIRSRNAPTG